MQPVLIRMELKYCERCGGLLLRPTVTDWVYCGPCGREMNEMAGAKPRRPPAAIANPNEASDGGPQHAAESRGRRS